MTPKITQESLFSKLNNARMVLDLDEEATLDEIKSTFRTCLKRWHPDTADDESIDYEEKTREVIAAYREIMAYCGRVKMSFSKEVVNRYRSVAESWLDQFGDGPL